MKRTQSSEIPLDNVNLSLKSNRVPYMGCQSLMYQNKITKETVLRQNKSLNISMEEVSNIPTSVLIHQSSPQSIPSFSTYHSDETVYNETYEITDEISRIYDYPAQNKNKINGNNKCKPQNKVFPIRQNLTQCQSFTSSNSSKKFLPFCGGNKSPSIHRSMTITNQSDKPLSFKKIVSVEKTQPLRPLSYQSTSCWNEFLSLYLTNGAKNISWTRPSLKQPLLNYVQKNQGKNAVKSFKVIQKYMGDRRTRKSPSQLIAKLQSYVSFNEALIDEILLQICKQTINNPDSRSSRRGWDLLSECLLQFAPSDKLLPYISDFVKFSLSCEEELNSSLNSSLTNIRKCEYHLSWSLKSKQPDSKDEGDSSIVTVINHKRKRSFSETKQNGVHDLVIYSPQTLSSLMKQQIFTFPSEEVPVELITICKQISVDLDNSDDFISLYRSFNDYKTVMKTSRNLEKWFNVSCQRGPHLIDRKSIPSMQAMSLHVLVYWFESLSQPVISQQMAFLSNFSIKDLTIINKKVLLYMVHFFQMHIISKSKDTVRNIASFLCSLIFQLPKEKYYPLDTPKDSVYMNIVLPIFKNYS